jgi:hypothetical protein
MIASPAIVFPTIYLPASTCNRLNTLIAPQLVVVDERPSKILESAAVLVVDLPDGARVMCGVVATLDSAAGSDSRLRVMLHDDSASGLHAGGAPGRCSFLAVRRGRVPMCAVRALVIATTRVDRYIDEGRAMDAGRRRERAWRLSAGSAIWCPAT